MWRSARIIPQQVVGTVERRAFSSGALPPRHPLPPFNEETARTKAKMAEAAWNTRDPEKVAGAYTLDSQWRNRDEFFSGREAIKAFLTRKWKKEKDYSLMKELWAYTGNHISVRFEYEWNDGKGQWYRSHGNEQWEFDDLGYMARRDASINDVPIKESDRRYLRDKEGNVIYAKDRDTQPGWKR